MRAIIAAIAVGAAASCTPAHGDRQTPPTSPPSTVAIGAADPPAVTGPPPARGAEFTPRSSTGLTPPRPLWVGVAPPLPDDLTPDRAHDKHGHGDEPAGATTAATVAVAWVHARCTARHDDNPSNRKERLAGLAATVAVAAEVAASPAIGTVEATWVVVGDVTALGGGWWRVKFTRKALVAGTVGPVSTPATLQVHVTAGLRVDAQRP